MFGFILKFALHAIDCSTTGLLRVKVWLLLNASKILCFSCLRSVYMTHVVPWGKLLLLSLSTF